MLRLLCRTLRESKNCRCNPCEPHRVACEPVHWARRRPTLTKEKRPVRRLGVLIFKHRSLKRPSELSLLLGLRSRSLVLVWRSRRCLLLCRSRSRSCRRSGVWCGRSCVRIAARSRLAAIVLLEETEEIELRQRELRQAQAGLLRSTASRLLAASFWSRSRSGLANFNLLLAARSGLLLAARSRLLAAVIRLSLSRNTGGDGSRHHQSKNATHEMSSQQMTDK